MGNELVLRVTDLSRGGAGVSRDSGGRVVFIPFSAPGDLVKVRIVTESKSYANAEILEILESAPIRERIRCPAFTHCGGCQWQHIPYEIQWNTKLKGVLEVLQREGIPVPPWVDAIPAQKIWEYRNRVQLRGEGDWLGFYKAKSRQIVPVQRCDIARSEINENWEIISSEAKQKGGAIKVEIQVLMSGEIKKTWNSPHSSDGFRQVHDEQNEKLKTWISETLSPSEVLFDLYGGSGNLSLSLSPKKFGEIFCVDLGAPLQMPSPAFRPGFYFFRAPVMAWLKKKVESVVSSERRPKSAAILDPPRQGLGKDLLQIAEALEFLNAKEIILVGCHTDSWARDLRGWLKQGWELKKTAVLDFFPQTPHVESVAYLVRK